MSEHYCPAGHEKWFFYCDICPQQKGCTFGKDFGRTLRDTLTKEPCSDPLPVQQPPNTPYPTIGYPGPDDDPNVACYRLGYDVGFNIGFADAIQQCREAVEKLLPDFLVGVDCSGGFNKPIHLVEVGAYKMGTILAAISKVGEGVK